MTRTPEQKLASLGLTLPAAPSPLAVYRPARQVGNTLYLSGQIPRNTDGSFTLGRLGRDATVEDGYEAARNVALQLLSVVKATIGDLFRVEAVAKVTGMVNAEPDFTDHAKVIDGCSELLGEVLGEAGHHARSAVGICADRCGGRARARADPVSRTLSEGRAAGECSNSTADRA